MTVGEKEVGEIREGGVRELGLVTGEREVGGVCDKSRKRSGRRKKVEEV